MFFFVFTSHCTGMFFSKVLTMFRWGVPPHIGQLPRCFVTAAAGKSAAATTHDTEATMRSEMVISDTPPRSTVVPKRARAAPRARCQQIRQYRSWRRPKARPLAAFRQPSSYPPAGDYLAAQDVMEANVVGSERSAVVAGRDPHDARPAGRSDTGAGGLGDGF